METQYIDHAEYQHKTKSMSADALRYTIKDASAAIAANPDGHKAGYYADEINYCAMALNQRTREQRATNKARQVAFVIECCHLCDGGDPLCSCK